MLFDFKKICPNLYSIYILPTNIEMAKEQTRKRHLASDIEQKRLLEIDEHYKKITTDEYLRSQFNYFFYNNYDKKSEDELLNLVRKLLNK